MNKNRLITSQRPLIGCLGQLLCTVVHMGHGYIIFACSIFQFVLVLNLHVLVSDSVVNYKLTCIRISLRAFLYTWPCNCWLFCMWAPAHADCYATWKVEELRDSECYFNDRIHDFVFCRNWDHSIFFLTCRFI